MNVAGVTISPKDDILNKIKDLPKDQKDEKLKELGITEAELNSSEIGVIHANGFKIAHIADGEVTKGSKAVVNGGQLYEVDEKAKSALNKATVNETSIQDNVGKITKNTQAITQNTTNIGKNTEKLNEHAQSIQGINNTLSEHTSSISSNTTKIEKGIVLDAGTRAEDVSGSRKVNLGEIIKIVGKNNINTVLEKDGSLSVVLNDSIELKKGNQSNDKLTINKSNSGKISGLSAGTEDLDATNLGQIKPLAKALNMNYENDGSIKEPKYKIGNGENNTFNTIQDALTAINTTAEKGANGKITFATGSKNKEVGLSETVYFEVDNTTNTKLLSIDLEDTGNRFKFKIDKNPTFGGKVTANGFDAQSNVISNVATGKNPNDAVNLQQLNDLKASFNLETGNTVSLTLNAPVSYKAEVNKKDGSNGKEETIVFKAKKEGEKVEKFYRKIDVDKNGKVLNEAVPLSDEELKTIKVAALDENQGLSNPLRFTNIADGDLNKGSKDAITGNQLKPLIDALGMTISGNTINNPNWTIGNNEYHSVAEVILGTVKGKIGTVIITDKDGNPALRATSHDGKTKAFYKAEDIDDAKSKELDKIVVKENAVAINEKDIQMSILDPISGLAKTGENGKNTRKLSNLASGTTDYDAVNVKQLKDLEIDLTLKGNKVKPVVTYDDKTKATITLGSENNPTTIKNLKDGTLSDKSTEAVTGAQLYKTNQEISSINSNISNINQGWKLSINDDKSGNKINYGDLVTFKTDGNLSFTNGDEEASEKNQHILKLSLNKIINVDDIKIATEEVGKNKTSLITGLTNTTWDENNVVKNRAATEGQIESAIDTINTNAKKAGNFTVKYAQKLNTVKPDYGRVMLVGEEDDANGNIGTVISNLKGGEVNANSKEAINGSQLYEYSSAIAKVIGGNENSYDPIKGKISDFSVKINDNNGNPSVMNNVKEALESLNAGWRILGGKIPNENGKLDAVAGATNVERGQSLGIFSSGNISTRVIKKEISLTPELDGSRLIIENNEIYTNADKTKKLDKEKFKTIKLADDKETLTWDQVEVQGNKVIKKDGNSEIKISSVVAPLEKRKTAYVDIAMTPTPDFDGVTVNKYGIKIKGYNEAKDKETGNNIVLNADGEGTITGLSNVDFKDGTGGKISLKTMTEDSLDNLGLMTNRAASEGQLKEIIADYIERTNKTITFNGDEKSVSKKLGESIEIKGGVKDESKLTSGNIGVIADDTNKLDIKLAKDLTGISSFSNLGSDGKNTTITISDSGKVIFARDTDVENKKDGVILSGIKDDESDLTSAVSRKSLSDKMTAISNKGLSFTANGISDLEKDKGTQEIHKNLGDKLGVIGGHKYTTEFTSTNLATKIEDGNIVIGMTETPKFKELTISKDGKDSVVTVNDKGELILKNGADGKDGKDKKWSEVVTRELLEKEGLIGKVNVDGKDGVKGPSGRDRSRGPAGKDGTNGANINEKVNALRNGEAGSLVYVNADGERVVRDENKFYPGDAVRASDGKWYPKGTTFTEDGKTPKENSDGTTPSEIKGIDAKDVQLAVVNPDGETKNNPTIIGNVASTIAPDLDKLNKAVSDAGTENKKEKEAELVKAAKDAVTGNTSSPNGLLQKSGKDLAKAATIGDLQTLAIAGLDFGANGITTGEGKEVHKKLGEKLAILGGENYDSSSFSSENVATMIDAKGDILIGMKKNPKFDTIVIQTPNKDTSKNPEITLKTLTTPNEDKTGVKPTLNFASGTGKVVLNGVADGTTEDSVVTKAALDKLVSKVGLDGTNGDRGPSGRDGSSGAIGADGLDGKNAPNLSEKINALRAGEAGAVVYVNEAGERVVRDGDNFYLADSVRGKDGQWYKKGTTLNKEGEPNNPGAPLAEKISVDKVQLAVVNPTGKTIEPTILRNIAGNIALEEVEKAKNELAKLEKAAGDDPSLAQDVSDAKLKLETAKKNISKEAADKIKELAVKNSEDLNRAATVGDLQTLAIAGLNFEANGVDSNTGKEVHKKLGEKLGVLGGTGNFFNNEYNSSNVATRVTTSGDIEIGFKKVPDFAGLVIAKDGVPGRDGKDAVITVDKDGKLIVKNGTDGVNGVNGIDGTSGKGTEIITREVLEKEGLVGKNGKDGANGVDGTNGRNGKDTSGNIVGPSGRDGLNGTNGKDAPTIGEKINALRNGEAGTLVYTTTDGERVVRDGDNFYKASELEGKVKGPNGKWYPAGTEFESNGTPKNGAVEETPKILNTSLPENKLQLAAVNADGSTSVATPVGNVASAIIDNTEVATAEKAVTTAEKTVVDTETKLRNEKIAIVNAKDEIAKIEADIAKKNTRIAELGSDPTDEVEKAKLQGEITALQANKTAAEREIATAEGKVTDLKANLETNKATLKTKLGELKVAKGPITEETAKEIVLGKDSGSERTGGLLKASGDTLNKVATVGDIQAVAQAGLDFGANGNIKTGTIDHTENNKIHRTVGQTLGILGDANNRFDSTFSSANLVTKVDGENIILGMKKTPEFAGIVINGKDGNNGKDAILTVNDKGRLIVKNSIDGKDGLDGNTGTYSEVVTREIFDKLAGKTGLDGKDGSDGANGRDGKVGDTIVGPAGQDGLNGRDGKDAEATTIIEKVNALRNGEAGSIVYTTADGERVVRDGDNFYKASEVLGKVKGKDASGNTVWYKEGTKLNKDGRPVDIDGEPLEKEELTAVIAKTPELLSDDEKEKIQLAAVDKDGSTKAPTTIGNVKSNIALDDKEIASAKETLAKAEKELKELPAGTDTKEATEKVATAKKALTDSIDAKAPKATAKVEELVITTGTDLNKAATVGDIQTLAVAGMNFEANGTADENSNETHKILGAKIGILGGTTYDINSFDFSNLSTVVENGDIKVAFKKVPKFNGLIIGKDGLNGKDAVITVDKEGKLIVKNGVDGSNGIDGVNGLDGKDGNGTQIITKDYLEKEGLIGKAGKDGVKGADGRDGKVGDTIVGPAGKDGLNGRDGLTPPTLNEKINALRNGEAGSVVYTDKDGNRVVRDGNDFYNADKIKNYIKVDDTWYTKDSIDPATGKLKTDGTAKEVTPGELAKAKVDKDNLQLVAVSPDGETTTPTTIGNVKSSIALNKVAKSELEKVVKGEVEGTDNTNAKALTKKAAAKVEKLVTTTGNDLNKAATVGDIQTLAVAGMNFEANGTEAEKNNSVHKILGAKLGVLGKAGNYFDDTYDSVNVATKVTDKGDIEIGIKKSPEFNEIVVHGKDGKDGKSAIITVDKDGNLAIKNGLNGVDGKDGIDGVNGENAKTTEIITKDYLEKEGLIAKDGVNGTSGSNGRDGAAGPAGRDGLSDTSLPDKVNALRNGEAGAIIYTDNKGNRVVRDGDTFYNADKIKDYVKVDNKFYKKDDVENGKPKSSAKAIEDATIKAAKVNKQDLELAAVSPDGGTKTATSIGNVASAIIEKANSVKTAEANVDTANKALTDTAAAVAAAAADIEVKKAELAKAEKAAGAGASTDAKVVAAKAALKDAKQALTDKIADLGSKQTALKDAETALENAISGLAAINATDAKNVVLGKEVAKGDGTKVREGGLLNASGATLNKVATVGDLQAVAQAELDFETNDGAGKAIHKTLGSTLKIEGKSRATYDETNYSSDNLVTRNDNGVVRVAMLKTPEFNGLTFKDNNSNKNITIVNNAGVLDMGGAVITNVQDGTSDNSVVTRKAFKEAVGGLTNKIFKLRIGNSEEEIEVKLGDTVNLLAGKDLVVAGKGEHGTAVATTGETVAPEMVVKPGDNTTQVIPESLRNSIATNTVENVVANTENTTSNSGTANTTNATTAKPETHVLAVSSNPDITPNTVTISKDDGNKKPVVRLDNKSIKFGDLTEKGEVNRDSNGNLRNNGTTTVIDENGITVTTTKNGIVDKETSNIVIKDGTITGLKNTEVDEKTGEFKEDQVVNGGTLNRVIEDVRKQNTAFGEGLRQVNQRVDRVENKMKKGLANAAAMAGMSFQDIGKNQAAVAAAVGGYEGTQAVAVGVQMAPTENVRVNAKMSLTPGKNPSSIYSVGASWKFDMK